MNSSQHIIVIGASAGGVETLIDVVARLPGDLPAPVFVVLHIPPYVASSLPNILSRSGPLPAVHPKDGEVINAGVIYVAPPDYHLLVDEGIIAIKKGPKENRFRPSIDALFRSAAYLYGTGAIGVVLSGALERQGSLALGEDAGLLAGCDKAGVAISSDPLAAILTADGILDFSSPAASVRCCARPKI